MNPFDRLLRELKAPVIAPRDVAQTICGMDTVDESIYRILECRFSPAKIAEIRMMVETGECMWDKNERRKVTKAGKCLHCSDYARPGKRCCWKCYAKNSAAKKRYREKLAAMFVKK